MREFISPTPKQPKQSEEGLKKIEAEILNERPFVEMICRQFLPKVLKDEAKDLSYEIVAHAVSKASYFTKGTDLRKWLAIVSRNMVFNFLRKIRNEPSNKKGVGSSDPFDNFQIIDTAINPEESMLQKENQIIKQKILEDGMETLSAKEREVMKTVLDNPGDEEQGKLAEKLNISPPMFRDILYKAKQKMINYVQSKK